MQKRGFFLSENKNLLKKQILYATIAKNVTGGETENMKKLLLLACAILIFIQNIGYCANSEIIANESKDRMHVVKGSGSFLLDIDSHESIEYARSQARQNAIQSAREAFGIYVEGQSKVKDGVLVGDEVITVFPDKMIIQKEEFSMEVMPDDISVLCKCDIIAAFDKDELSVAIAKKEKEGNK